MKYQFFFLKILADCPSESLNKLLWGRANTLCWSMYLAIVCVLTLLATDIRGLAVNNIRPQQSEAYSACRSASRSRDAVAVDQTYFLHLFYALCHAQRHHQGFYSVCLLVSQGRRRWPPPRELLQPECLFTQFRMLSLASTVPVIQGRDWLVSVSEMIVSLSELVRHRDQATDGICY